MSTIHLEVLYSGDHNLSCYYMTEVVKVVASSFQNELRWDVVYIFKMDGASRFYDLSVALYGEEKVKKYHYTAPVPAIFINGRLIFDSIPMVEELEEVIRKMI
ncbi:MAG: thioredoxin-like protein [Bacillota bacterium]